MKTTFVEKTLIPKYNSYGRTFVSKLNTEQKEKMS